MSLSLGRFGYRRISFLISDNLRVEFLSSSKIDVSTPDFLSWNAKSDFSRNCAGLERTISFGCSPEANENVERKELICTPNRMEIFDAPTHNLFLAIILIHEQKIQENNQVSISLAII